MTYKQKKLIVVIGPTAVGKTALAIKLAQKFNTEIISADSRQFYREMKIGNASPTHEELNSAKHYFIGHLSVTDYYNASKFENDALSVLDIIFKKSDYALMVGGSGLYIDAACTGIDELPDVDTGLRNEIRQLYKYEGIICLQKELKRLDPEYYDIVDKANPKRLMRAIEICRATGKKFSELRKNEKKQRDFSIIKIGLNMEREMLFDRINKRVDKMIEDGLVEEVKSLQKFRSHNALNTVGYKEVFSYLDKEISFKKAIGKIKTNTRRYAKRQTTWFKGDDSIKWFHPSELDKIIEYLQDV